MHHYRAYGLSISSEFELPELTPAPPSDAVDVVIEAGNVTVPVSHHGAEHAVHASGESISMEWPHIARFRVTGGRKITVDAEADADARLVRLLTVGQCLGVVLHQRGNLVLHASAVAIHGRGVIFAGHKGFGKSTTAATLHGRGHTLVADDVVSVDLSRDEPRLSVGSPQIKLWPGSVEAALGTAAEDLPVVTGLADKRAFMSPDRPAVDFVPLKFIFLLAGGDSIRLSRLTPHQGFVELVRFTYVPSLLRHSQSMKTHFAQCVALADRVPVIRLERPDDLSRLMRLAEVIEETVAREA